MTAIPARGRARRPRALALTLAAGLLAGCGSATFTAEELVAEVNRHGGELALGEPLVSEPGAPEIHSLTLTSSAPAQEDAQEDSHAAGTLLITEDDDDALSEYRRCESAASLICFRAANALLVFEGEVPEADMTRLGQAIRAMGSE